MMDLPNWLKGRVKVSRLNQSNKSSQIARIAYIPLPGQRFWIFPVDSEDHTVTSEVRKVSIFPEELLVYTRNSCYCITAAENVA